MRNDISAFRVGSIITKIVVIFIFSTAVSMAVFYLWQSGGLFSEIRASDSYLNIIGPYSNSKMNAKSDAAEGSTYEWSVNSQVTESGIVPTTFLAHFNNSLTTAGGEEPVSVVSEQYENSKFGQGLIGSAEYSIVDNIDFNEGTFDIIFTLKKPLDDPAFDTSPYIFRYSNAITRDSFMINIHSVNTLKFTMYDDTDGWADSLQAETNQIDIPINTPTHITATWSSSERVAKFYLNGEQAFRRDYTDEQFFPSIVAGPENLIIGNENVVIDEIRFLNTPLESDVIHEYYKRADEFSESDIYYEGDLSVGDEVELVLTNGGILLSDSATVLEAKIAIQNPDGYFVPYTNQFTIDFTTPSVMVCKYGDNPDLYDSLPYVAGPSGTSHTIVQDVNNVVDQFPIAIKCGSEASDSDDYGFFRQYRVLPDIPQTYPKISKLWWGNSPDPSEIDYLKKFDMVSVAKSSFAVTDTIRQLKEANPEAVILFYKTAVGYQNFTGIAYKTFEDRLNPSLRLQSSENPGTYCINVSFPNNLMYNLYTGSPFTDISAEHLEKDMFDRVNYFDGIWWDVTGPSFWFLYDYVNNPGVHTQYCDFDLDGIDEDINDPADLAKATQIWIDGMHAQMQKSRARLGQGVLTVGNGNAVDHADYNGNLWEEVLEPSTFDYYFNPENTRGFEYWQSHSLEPKLNENLFANNNTTGGTSYYRYNRFGLTSALMTGVYHNPQKLNENRPTGWFDEYWVDLASAQPTEDRSAGRGYLGLPLNNYSEIQPGVYRRDFENGIAILNSNYSSAVVDLGESFRYIDGSQDPVANPGGETSSVTLSGIDGRILLNSLPPQDSTPPGTINDLYTE